MAFNSPLRYPGGKGKLAKYIKSIYRENQLPRANYYEVFAGGSGIALDLLFSDLVTDIFLNDLNTAITSFWYAVINNTESLCQKIQNASLTIAEWEQQKQIQYNPENQQVNNLDLAFSTFYLNRVNRSGIIKGGIIGGIEQTGPYQMDARFNKLDLIKRIQKIATFSDRIRIYNLDGVAFIQNILPTMPNDGFVYFDPPYYKNGQKLYDNFFTHADHVTLASEIRNIKQHWLVSYDNVPEIQELYLDHTNIDYELHYTAQVKYIGSEVMFCSKTLHFPTNESLLNL